MSTQEIFEAIDTAYAEFKANHEKFTERNNKAAGTRARKYLQEVKKLVIQYKKQSILDIKENRETNVNN